VVEGAQLCAYFSLMRDHTPSALRSAKRLRSEMSLPEVILWRLLRKKPLGVKFRRQHPIGSYVADFYCDAADLIIEIDGIAHNMGDRPERDEKRDVWLLAYGKQVLRIPATDVLKDAATVADSIVALCAAAPPPSVLRTATSPEGGGLLKAR
jgi:very-short-patch-repair endonuclease